MFEQLVSAAALCGDGVGEVADEGDGGGDGATALLPSLPSSVFCGVSLFSQ